MYNYLYFLLLYRIVLAEIYDQKVNIVIAFLMNLITKTKEKLK